MRKRVVWQAAVLAALPSLVGCGGGYMKAEDLEAREQGPSHCASRCHELGMRMGALVLVSDQIPGCVCVPAGVAAHSPPQAQRGVSAVVAGHVVLAAAAAAREAQAAQQQQQQQQHQPYRAP